VWWWWCSSTACKVGPGQLALTGNAIGKWAAQAAHFLSCRMRALFKQEPHILKQFLAHLWQYHLGGKS
jgi:hypothetical protein